MEDNSMDKIEIFKSKTFDDVFWAFNLPLQIGVEEDEKYPVLVYMPRKERCMWLSVPKEEIIPLCKSTANILRNLAKLFDAVAEGKEITIYYPDETLEEAIKNN